MLLHSSLLALAIAIACVSRANADQNGTEVLALAGFFPLSKSWASLLGRQDLVASQLALQHVNENGILPGYNVTLDVYDNEGSIGGTVDTLLRSLTQKQHAPILVCCLLSSTTEIVLRLSSRRKILQIANGGSSPSFSDRATYPYFFRTMVSASKTNTPKLALMQAFGWNKLSILTNNVEPHISVTNLLSQLLINNNKTIVASEAFTISPEGAIRRFKAKDVRIIVANVHEGEAKEVMCQAYKYGLFGVKYIWFFNGYFTPGWWKVLPSSINCTQEEMATAVEGYITIVYPSYGNLNQRTVSGKKVLEIKNTLIDLLSTNPWKNEHQNNVAHAYDAIWASALALRDVIFASNMTSENVTDINEIDITSISNAMQNVAFDGFSGRVTFDNSDRETFMLIEQCRNGTETVIGQYDEKPNILTWSRPLHEIWYRHGGQPPLDSVIQVDRLVINSVTVESFWGITCISVIGIVLTIALTAVNFIFRKHRYDRSNQVDKAIVALKLVIFLSDF